MAFVVTPCPPRTGKERFDVEYDWESQPREAAALEYLKTNVPGFADGTSFGGILIELRTVCEKLSDAGGGHCEFEIVPVRRGTQRPRRHPSDAQTVQRADPESALAWVTLAHLRETRAAGRRGADACAVRIFGIEYPVNSCQAVLCVLVRVLAEKHGHRFLAKLDELASGRGGTVAHPMLTLDEPVLSDKYKLVQTTSSIGRLSWVYTYVSLKDVADRTTHWLGVFGHAPSSVEIGFRR